MEPLAPGTEDDVNEYSSLYNKDERELILNKKTILWNGLYESIFQPFYEYGKEHWFCKICNCRIFGRIYPHEAGHKHVKALQMISLLKKSHAKEPVESVQTRNPEVAFGEPAPPGIEEEVVSEEAQIQEKLDGYNGPFVALEYLIELYDYDPIAEPYYLCLLCDKRGDPRTVITHLSSYNHISQYLQRHFPQCYRKLAPYMTKQYKRNYQVTLQKIATAIESKFGRLKPIAIDKDKFDKNRLHYITLISKGKHFYETMGNTFVDLVVPEELTKTFEVSDGVIKPGTLPTNNWGGKPFIQKPFQKRGLSPPTDAPQPKILDNTINEAKNVPGQNKPLFNNSKKVPRKPDVVSKKSDVVPKKSDVVPKKLDVVPKKSDVVPKKSDVVPKKSDFVPKNSGIVSRRRSMSSISSGSSDGKPGKGKRSRNTSPPAKFRRRSPSPRKNRVSYRKQIKQTEEEKQRIRERERLKKLEEFKRLSMAIQTDLDKTLKSHEKNPEKHPKYNDEWKAFWNKRYKELLAEGKDASKYDFKPEWIDFWGKRMVTLHQEDLQNRKDALRKRLGLPEEPPPVSFRIQAPGAVPKTATNPPAPKETKPIVTIIPKPIIEPEVILIDDKDDKIDSDSSRSRSPWEKESPPPRSKSRVSSQRDRLIRPKDSRIFEKRRSVERDSRGRSRRSRSRDFPRERSLKSPRRSLSRDRRSRSHDSSRKKPVNDRDYRDRNRRGRSREKSRDADREKYRESSFERDLKGKERIRTIADLPWEKQKNMYTPLKPPYYGSSSMNRNIVEADDDDDEEVNIVSVLRLLTALEEKLGSLGPKIIDLLAQALALEKNLANSSESLLDNEINCVMFETVKEKLKGQLLAGLVGPIQERAFKKAIRKTANLIHLAAERKKKGVSSQLGALAVPGVGAVDKTAIAKQLANALIAQGKTDVTQDQLEQLINTVVGMAEASKSANKPITTADFLAQLTGGKNVLTESPKEKIIIPRVKPRQDKHFTDTDVELGKLTESLSPSTPEKYYNNMENLSDSDLQTLLQNFKDLSTEEQMNLIQYLKKMELNEPERVERLRGYVNLGSDKLNKSIDLEKEESNSRRNGRDSPFSSRLDGINPDADDLNRGETKHIHLDSEDEDYSYDDVVKAASKNIKQQEIEDTRKIIESSMSFSSNNSNLTDAKALISNLMSSFSSNPSSSGISLMGLPSVTRTTSITNFPISTSSTDLVRNLGDINMDNLAKIVSSVQKATQSGQQKQDSMPFQSSEMDLPRDKRSHLDNSEYTNQSDLQRSSINTSGSVIPPLFPHQSQRPPNQHGMGFGQGLHQDPRGLLASKPLGIPNQGYPHQNLGARAGPQQGPFNQRPLVNNNAGNGNYNLGFQGPRPGRPLLNLTFGNPKFSGNNPHLGGPRPTNYDRW